MNADSSVFTQGFLLGLALSPTCLGVCLPLLFPFFSADGREPRKKTMEFLLFLAGRLLGYLLIGMLAGWMGSLFAANALPAGMVSSFYIIMGVILLLFALLKSFPHWSLCRITLAHSPETYTAFSLGLITGLNICPPFLAAWFQAARTGGMVAGTMVMAAFFLGTSIILLPLPALGWLGKTSWLQRVGKISAWLMAFWFILQGVLLLAM